VLEQLEQCLSTPVQRRCTNLEAHLQTRDRRSQGTSPASMPAKDRWRISPTARSGKLSMPLFKGAVARRWGVPLFAAERSWQQLEKT